MRFRFSSGVSIGPSCWERLCHHPTRHTPAIVIDDLINLIFGPKLATRSRVPSLAPLAL
jgi:hypothetical protein